MPQHFTFRSACPVCSCKSARNLYAIPYSDLALVCYLDDFYGSQGGRVNHALLADASYIVDQCSECALVFQRLVPDAQLLTLLYDHWIDPAFAYQNHLAERTPTRSLEAAADLANAIATLRKPPHQIHAFDFGMGWGDWCRLARAFGCQVSGCELSFARREQAIRDGIALIDGKLPHRSFDLINADQVFEHLITPLEILRDLAMALKPGGLIRLSVPSAQGVVRLMRSPDWSLPKKHPRSLNVVAPLEHLNGFTERSLKLLARQAQLVPIKILTPHIASWRHAAFLLKQRLLQTILSRDIITFYLALA